LSLLRAGWRRIFRDERKGDIRDLLGAGVFGKDFRRGGEVPLFRREVQLPSEEGSVLFLSGGEKVLFPSGKKNAISSNGRDKVSHGKCLKEEKSALRFPGYREKGRGRVWADLDQSTEEAILSIGVEKASFPDTACSEKKRRTVFPPNRRE